MKLQNQLQRAYTRKGVVVVLGAGVSVASGVPSWEDLLVGVARRIGHGQQLYQTLRDRGFSLPAIATEIEGLFGSRQRFLDFVRGELYSRTRLGFISAKTTEPRDFVDHVRECNTTLRAVAAFCATRGAGIYAPNAHVRCVVSFNLDTLLELFVERRYSKPLLRPIDHPASASTPKLMSVYHIHGYLPFGRAAPSRVVLTEADYFDFFGDPFGAFTYSFLHFLREQACVFIGLSMRDDNLRRLLYYSVRERRLALRAAGAGGRSDVAANRHFAILARSHDHADSAVEAGLVRLGVRVLWLADHSELPSLLAQVYESTGDSWADVY